MPDPKDVDQDDAARRRFREALERKKGRAGGDAGAASEGGSAKPHGASGPAKSQRTFRRKSGG